MHPCNKLLALICQSSELFEKLICILSMNLWIYFFLIVFQSTARERGKHSDDYFTLLRHLLNYAYNSNINVPNAEVLLNNEIDWLKRIRVSCILFVCCSVLNLFFFFFACLFFICFYSCTCRIWSSQARGRVGAPAASLRPQPKQHQIQAMYVTCRIAHGNTGSFTCWVRLEIKPEYMRLDS